MNIFIKIIGSFLLLKFLFLKVILSILDIDHTNSPVPVAMEQMDLFIS